MPSWCYEPLSPRKPQGLPYLQPNRVGRLSYVRRIAPELQSYAGNRKAIRRSLGLSSTNQADPAVIQAWNRVHREAEELISHANDLGAPKALQPPVDPRGLELAISLALLHHNK